MAGEVVRRATAADLERILELAAAKRAEYAAYAPVYWRPAGDAVERHRPWLLAQIENEDNISFVAELAGTVAGFIIAQLVPAPPVYDPGGATCFIDDFAVERAAEWSTVGRALLDRATDVAKERGAVQTAVNCALADEPKHAMLSAAGHSISNAVHVRPL
jgi:GNAT superfamily N-acetyltransferase